MPPITRSRRSMSSSELSPGLEEAELGGGKSRRRRPADEDLPLSLAGDKGSLLLLLLLYTLQGVPMGLAATVTLLLQERGASYDQQAVFRFVSLPFSLKILWAPLVDSLFFRRVGQRRSWLIPVQVRRRRRRARRCHPLTPLRAQTLVGLLFLLLGPHVQQLLDGGGGAGGEADVSALTALFFLLYLLMATQDVAVDGWALTMLSRRNVGLASTVNVIGQALGGLLAYTGYVHLADAGWTTLGGFMWFWGLVFLLSAAAVAATPEVASEEESARLSDVYRHVLRLLRLPAIARLLLLLLTSRAAFAASDTLTQFVLMERGMSKSKWADFASLLAPLEMFLPILLAKWTGGERPMGAFLAAYPLRLAVGVATAAVVASSPTRGAPRWGFELAVLLVLAAGKVASQAQFVAQMAFFARVSDPAIGGTAMTLLNTVANLASMWPSSLVLFAAGPLTRRACVAVAGGAVLGGEAGTCKGGGAAAKELCTAAGGRCELLSDALTPLTVACTVLGVAWLALWRAPLEKLQQEPLSAWRPSGGVRRHK